MKWNDSLVEKQDLIKQKENRKSHYVELINFMPHKDKVCWAKTKIQEFISEIIEFNKHNPEKKYNEITISFSGGKDSTVLLDLVLKVHKSMKCKIPLQPCYAAEITFPSTYKFIREVIAKYQETFEYLKDPLILNPKMPWIEILEAKGYPIFSKQISVLINRVSNAKTKNALCKWFFGIDVKNTNTSKYKLSFKRLFLLDKKLRTSWPMDISEEAKQYFSKYNAYYFISEKCCDFVKGSLKHDKRPSFVGTMAIESNLRKKSWIDRGCNIFDKTRPTSRPLSLWKTIDIWTYIRDNHLMVNPAYGYRADVDLDKQKLYFNRLGCSSCPFGSNIEQRIIDYAKRKNQVNSQDLQNRFEVLKEKYPNIYQSQIIKTGMYKIIIDMGIPIHNDDLYMELFTKRQNQINDWYDKKNIRNNILYLLAQIENYQDYKNKGPNYEWSYTLEEVNDSMKYFGFKETTHSEFARIRKALLKFEKLEDR